MGIVNNTPDSFYDRGRHHGPQQAIAHGQALIADGADLLDIGGQTGRAGPEIDPQTEIDRVVPVITGLRDHVVSVDTYRAVVAAEALHAGAVIVNDYTGGYDPDVARVVADADAALIITHYRGTPRSNPSRSYDGTVDDVLRFLDDRARRAVAAGVNADSVIVDPGFGFGKTTRFDLALLRDLERICALGFPVLAACSHKEFTADATASDELDLPGTIAAAVLAARAGAGMLRLHDIAQVRPAVMLADAVRHVTGA